MSQIPKQDQPIFDLMEALCEGRITRKQAQRLQEIVLRDQTARQIYLSYLDLHGTLHWNAGTGVEQDAAIMPLADRDSATIPRRRTRVLVTSVCAVLVAVGGISTWTYLHTQEHLATNDTESVVPAPASDGQSVDQLSSRPPPKRQRELRKPSIPPDIRVLPSRVEMNEADQVAVKSDSTGSALPIDAHTNESATVAESSQSIVTFINERIREGWQLYQVEPSQKAGDEKWFRRAYLDVVGQIPSAEATVSFLENKADDKRSHVIDRLLDDSGYIRNWTTIWTNLLIGRSDERDVNRPALQKYLRESFARNRPWSQMVSDFVAAEGDCEENGAASFLLAHLNNQAVPATAITSRLFLGVQVHCTQCHDHPLHRDWGQNQFWELHSFFQQTAKIVNRKRETTPSRSGVPNVALVSRQVGGPTFYETRSGLMRVAYPKFAGEAVDPDPNVNRRQRLAVLMTGGPNPLIAQAMVNRMWGHFFGCGFTPSVDDMGPHNPSTHPALLDRLAREFVKSGYDLKQLIRWICNSEAYQLSSRFGSKNQDDDPAAGASPLFSRVYLKSMTAEQLFDSLLIATQTHHTWGSDWTEVERKRQQWLQQFVIALQTDENDEATTFDGTIPQALMMMNSDLTQQALDASRGTYLSEIVREFKTDVERIQRICLATLNRYPHPQELAAFKKLLGRNPIRGSRRAASDPSRIQRLQDICWAYLNSNEFILIH